MEETEQEMRRRTARERKRRERARRSPSKVEAARAADAQRRRLVLLHETEYEREVRRSRERVRQRIKRQSATPEEIVERRRREREATAERRKLIQEDKRRRDKDLNAYKRLTRQQSKLQCLKKRNSSQRKKSQCQKVERAMVSSENDPVQQPTAPRKFQTKQLDETNLLQKNQFENAYVGKRQMSTPVATPSAQIATQPASRHVQVLASPDQIAEPKPIQKHQPQFKKMLLISNHQQSVMSNLSSLWKNRKLCDAAIGNGTSIVKVHKVVLSAVCPKLLSLFSTDILSREFPQVHFSEEVSTEALNAFAKYMYNGIVDLDCNILKHLKSIAKMLDMKEFEQLCDSHLSNNSYQSADAVPAMTSLLASLDSPVYMDSTPSVTTRVVDINQESMEAELGQVKMETGHMFNQEIEIESPAPNKSGNDICPNIKMELVGPDNNKYGYLSSSSNQVFTSTTSSSPSSLAATAASTSISSVPASSTKFPIPFSQSTDGKSTKLKPTPSYETPLVSDLSPVSHIGETVCSQSSAMNEDSSKQLNGQSISTSSLQLPLTSTNNAGIYPVALFMAGGDNLPLLTPNAKSIDLCKTELT